MRHGKRFNHLGRKSAHRKAMLANMASSLIEHKRIRTTLAKAKALRSYIEPLITKSKNDTTHSRRVVFSYLKQKNAITELFTDIATKISDRPGGYTRIIKLNNRLGDNAQMAFIELVDYNDDYATDKPKRKKSRRTRRKSSSESTLLDNNTVNESNDKISEKSDSNNQEKVKVNEEKTVQESNKKDIEQAGDKIIEKEAKDNDVKQKIEETTADNKEEKNNKNPENQESKGE